MGRGSRMRREVDYSDSLKEKEWLKVWTSSVEAVDGRIGQVLYLTFFVFCFTSHSN